MTLTSTSSSFANRLEDLPVYNLATMKAREGQIAKGGVSCPFPWRLHECLDAVEREGLTDIISWRGHGRAFTVHQPKKFVELVMPRFFGQTKYPSFQRQLNIYGFNRFLQGPDKGCYYHLCFVRDHRDLVRNMVRRKVKGGRPSTARDAYELESKFDFYNPVWKNHFEPTMPVMKVQTRTPFHSSKSAKSVVSNDVAAPMRIPSSPVVSSPLVSMTISDSFDDLEPINKDDVTVISEEDLDVTLLQNVFNTSDDLESVSTISQDDLSSIHDIEKDAADKLLMSFEGNMFHMMEEPTPVVISAPCGCDCNCAMNKQNSFTANMALFFPQL